MIINNELNFFMSETCTLNYCLLKHNALRCEVIKGASSYVVMLRVGEKRNETGQNLQKKIENFGK